MNELKSYLISGFAFGTVFSLLLIFNLGWKVGIPLGIVSGFAFGVRIYFFATSKTVKAQTQIAITESKIVYSGGANHFKNWEAVGGKLYLTKDQLIFKSHHFNHQNHELKIQIENIDLINYFRIFGIVPNGLVLNLNSGVKEKFVINNRKTWKKLIEENKNRT